MNDRVRNRLTVGAGAILTVLALSVLTATIAGAAPTLTQLQRAHDAFNVPSVNAPPAGGSLVAATGAIRGPLGGRTALVGRARLPVRPATTGTGGAGWAIGALAIAALGVGSIAVLSRRSRSEVTAETASVTSIGDSSAGRATAQTEESGRKAA